MSKVEELQKIVDSIDIEIDSKRTELSQLESRRKEAQENLERSLYSGMTRNEYISACIGKKVVVGGIEVSYTNGYMLAAKHQYEDNTILEVSTPFSTGQQLLTIAVRFEKKDNTYSSIDKLPKKYRKLALELKEACCSLKF